MARRCLDRLTLLSVAAERCPPATLRRVRQHLPECSRCRARLIRAAEGQLGDTVDDEPRRLSRRPLAVALGAGLVAAVAFAGSRRWLTEVALTEVALTEAGPLETTPTCVIVPDAPKLDPDFPCDVSPRAAPSPARPEQSPPRPARVADAPEADLARARVGVLVDGRRVRLTLD